jgi:hypothetical protein
MDTVRGWLADTFGGFSGGIRVEDGQVRQVYAYAGAPPPASMAYQIAVGVVVALIVSFLLRGRK